MEFKQALVEIDKGNKVRRARWDGFLFLQKKNDLLTSFRKEAIPFIYDNSIIESGGWVSDNDTTYNFLEMLEWLKKKKKMRLKEWPEDWYLEMSENRKDLILNKTCEYPYTPTLECFLSEDWEVS